MNIGPPDRKKRNAAQRGFSQETKRLLRGVFRKVKFTFAPLN